MLFSPLRLPLAVASSPHPTQVSTYPCSTCIPRCLRTLASLVLVPWCVVSLPLFLLRLLSHSPFLVFSKTRTFWSWWTFLRLNMRMTLTSSSCLPLLKVINKWKTLMYVNPEIHRSMSPCQKNVNRARGEEDRRPHSGLVPLLRDRPCHSARGISRVNEMDFLLSFFNVDCLRLTQTAKHLPAVQESQIPPLGREDPLEEGMATHSSILAWRISWTEELLAGYSPRGCKESDTTE